jgi:hypothetical protein
MSGQQGQICDWTIEFPLGIKTLHVDKNEKILLHYLGEF